MTEQEIQTIIDIGDALRAQPMSWDQIPPETKETVISIMRPNPSFIPEQRDFLSRWWMQVDDDSLNVINQSLPSHTVCSPRLDVNGDKWLCADLFTDAVEESGRLRSLLPLLLSLQLHYKTTEDWPLQTDE